ncbi:hypothetical protein Tco_0838231 [Tanacetum coccineum]|uniref:Uncharacterized protein n=1 Tax=Tanacetum coccineum TaxID=301880 RepID=A0ABQ5ANZ2_9ASTR
MVTGYSTTALVSSTDSLRRLQGHCMANNDLIFFGGGDDEDSAAAKSIMHASVDGDRGVQQKGQPELGAPPPPRPPHPSKHHHHCRHHHQMTHYHHCLLHRQYSQQDPPQGLPLSSSRLELAM